MSFPRGFIPSIEEYRDFGPTGWLSTTPLMRGDYVPVYMMGEGPPPPIHEVKQSRFMSGFGGFGGVTPSPLAMPVYGDLITRHLSAVTVIDPTLGRSNKASRALGTLLQKPNNWPAVQKFFSDLVMHKDSPLDPKWSRITAKIEIDNALKNHDYLTHLQAWYDNFHATGGLAARPFVSSNPLLSAGGGQPPAAGGSYEEEEGGFPWLPVVGGVVVLGAIIGVIWVAKNK